MHGAGSPLSPGTVVGAYVVVGLHAVGGMGCVYCARDRRGAPVALKVLRADRAQQQTFRRLFLEEARVAARVRSPHVPRLLDSGPTSEGVFLAFEWVDGPSLAHLLRDAEATRVPLSVPMVAAVAFDVLSALDAVHSAVAANGEPLDLVHRDVGEENVLVGSDGVARVIDFGIARANERLAEATRAGHVRGKARYMAPEQALGRWVDSRADLFAVGALVDRMLLGDTPFQSLDDLARYGFGRSELPRPRERVDRAGSAFGAWVAAMLAPLPEGRPPTAAGAQQGLLRALDADGTRWAGDDGAPEPELRHALGILASRVGVSGSGTAAGAMGATELDPMPNDGGATVETEGPAERGPADPLSGHEGSLAPQGAATEEFLRDPS